MKFTSLAIATIATSSTLVTAQDDLLGGLGDIVDNLLNGATTLPPCATSTPQAEGLIGSLTQCLSVCTAALVKIESCNGLIDCVCKLADKVSDDVTTCLVCGNTYKGADSTIDRVLESLLDCKFTVPTMPMCSATDVPKTSSSAVNTATVTDVTTVDSAVTNTVTTCPETTSAPVTIQTKTEECHKCEEAASSSAAPVPTEEPTTYSWITVTEPCSEAVSTPAPLPANTSAPPFPTPAPAASSSVWQVPSLPSNTTMAQVNGVASSQFVFGSGIVAVLAGTVAMFL